MVALDKKTLSLALAFGVTGYFLGKYVAWRGCSKLLEPLTQQKMSIGGRGRHGGRRARIEQARRVRHAVHTDPTVALALRDRALVP